MRIIYIIYYFIVYTYCKNNVSIVSNNRICTKLGKQIILKNGNIIDSAISIMLCEGILNPEDSGIGGGFYGIFKLNNNVFILNSRERTPKNINHRNIINKQYCNIGIPSSLKGYEVLHKKYGKLSWKKIFLPIIKLCNTGFASSKLLTNIIDFNKFYHIVNYKINNTSYFIKNIKLCNTLKQISIHGVSYFYNVLSKKIIKELSYWNKYISYNDFTSYKPLFAKPSYGKINNYEIYSSSYPAPGKNIIKEFKNMIINKNSNLLTIIKRFYTNAMIERYNHYPYKKNHNNTYGTIHGTSNICIKYNKDVLCITSTINTYFGSKFFSNSTGIILNNQLNDIPLFYTLIPPKIIPPTSISTTLIFKDKKFYMGLGGTGGNRIPAGVLNVLYYHFVFKYPFKMSIHMNRFFNMYNNPEYENCVSRTLLCSKFKKILKLFYKNKLYFTINKSSYNTVTGIQYSHAIHDPRRGGLGISFNF